MLFEYLSENRAELIARCRAKVAERRPDHMNPTADQQNGIPMFLDQLVKTLQVEQTSTPMDSRMVSGPAGGEGSDLSEIGRSAGIHGRDLLRRGFTVEQVVHDYGDLCQAITDLAFESNEPIATEEFRTLNRCLDNAIADAVSEFNVQRNSEVVSGQKRELNERLGFFAHELRNFLNSAMLAVGAIKAGSVGLGGATGAVLDRSLAGMRNLIDQSLAEVRLSTGSVVQKQIYSVVEIIAEAKLSGSLEAAIHGANLSVGAVDAALGVMVDRDMLSAAIGNLMQNAFKFTKRGTEICLNAGASDDRIVIEVADHCGGLPRGDVEEIFALFTQNGDDKTGLGLGLPISRRNIEANGGTLTARDNPGTGCVFTISLPRHSLPLLAASAAPESLS